MRLTLCLMLVGLACVGLVSCDREAPESETTGTRTSTLKRPGDGSAMPRDWEPLPIVLPRKAEPRDYTGYNGLSAFIDDLAPVPRGPRPDFMAPAGIKNVALKKSMTSSTIHPFKGNLSQIVDGVKDPNGYSEVLLGDKIQWVQIDLGAPHELWAIVVWRFHWQQRVHFDVIVQVADDSGFTTNVRTVFNNDLDNSSGLGRFTDKLYVETADKLYVETFEGKLINAKQQVAQYVRLYSNENCLNDRSHYQEIEVYGRPAE
jgi:hypothetical protein